MPEEVFLLHQSKEFSIFVRYLYYGKVAGIHKNTGTQGYHQ